MIRAGIETEGAVAFLAFSDGATRITLALPRAALAALAAQLTAATQDAADFSSDCQLRGTIATLAKRDTPE